MEAAGAPGTVEEVAKVLASTLGVDPSGLDAATPLFGSLPELDSMAVVELIVALEQHFSMDVDEDDVTAEVFETVGSLAAFVDSQRR